MQYEFDHTNGWHVYTVDATPELCDLLYETYRSGYPWWAQGYTYEIAYSLERNVVDIRVMDERDTPVDGWTIELYSERGAKIQDYLVKLNQPQLLYYI